MTTSEAHDQEKGAESMKSSMQGLLESIKSPDMCRMFGINIARWLVHIYFFIQKIIEKDIIDVELTKRPI